MQVGGQKAATNIPTPKEHRSNCKLNHENQETYNDIFVLLLHHFYCSTISDPQCNALKFIQIIDFSNNSDYDIDSGK